MRVEFDSETDTIEVDGVRISLELLKYMANPDPSKYIKLIRNGSQVICYQKFEWN